MDRPDINDTGIDPDLDARFSDLNMSAAPADRAVQDTTAVSSFWPEPFPSQAAAATGFEPATSPLVTDALPAQIDAQHPSFEDYDHYPDETAAQPYWDPDDGTAQAGPSSDPAAAGPSFPCDDCPRSFGRQCDLEYVPVHT
jgi:hypothetical protein